LLGSCARRDRRAFDQIVFEDGLHRLDERRSPLRSSSAEDGRQKNGNNGTPRPRSCIADPMYDEARRRLRGPASVAPCPHRNVGQCSRVDPVGGAPSRSGFLATPINASSWQTFSTEDTVSREKRCRVGRLVRAFRTVRVRKTKSRSDPKGDRKKKSVQSPMQEPAKTPWRKAVVTGFASTDAWERDSIPSAQRRR
jgi:hypothetical protein